MHDIIGIKGNVYVSGVQQCEFKTRKSEIVNKALSLGNIVQYDDNTVQQKTSFDGHIFHFSLDHANLLDTTRIGKIHKYLDKKYGIY